MVSQVIQQGNCNAPATYQTLMNHLFSAYIGWFMDVYLDDIIIYSNSLKEHITHVKLVIDILHCEKLYVSEKKLNFLAEEIRILRWIVDSHGTVKDQPVKQDHLFIQTFTACRKPPKVWVWFRRTNYHSRVLN
jgi:Reverse transcriptase (RNA-dependent DNA polymerase)